MHLKFIEKLSGHVIICVHSYNRSNIKRCTAFYLPSLDRMSIVKLFLCKKHFYFYGKGKLFLPFEVLEKTLSWDILEIKLKLVLQFGSIKLVFYKNGHYRDSSPNSHFVARKKSC